MAPYSEATKICDGKIQTILLNRMCNTGPQYERLLQFQSYTNLKFLKDYESLDYVKRFIVKNMADPSVSRDLQEASIFDGMR